MNAFIEMRKSYFKDKSIISFPEFYLINHSYFDEQDDIARFSLINKIASIRKLYADENITEDQIIHILCYLGENDYLDRYIVGLLIKHKTFVSGNGLSGILIKMLIDPQNTYQKLCHLLDICIECDCPLLKGENLQNVFHQHENDFDGLSMLVEYMIHFHIDDFADALLDYLGHDCPENIKMQIIDLLLHCCHLDEKNVSQLIRLKIPNESDSKLYLDYLKFISGEALPDDPGIVVVQAAFYGNPEFSGKGVSGGLGTLLRTLGNQLAKHKDVSKVITLTINNNWRDGNPFMGQLGEHHWIVRLPIFLNAEDQHVLVRKELSIKRSVAGFMKKWHVKPDIFHVRYLDNASRSIAVLCKEINIKLVFTLTPDPHRTMADQSGELACFKIDETLEKLNKIIVGDELLSIADGVVGIGGQEVKEELEQYFPQLKFEESRFSFKMIGEGINTEIDPFEFDLWRFLEDHSVKYSIGSSFRSKPVILNVGRLNRQKGQNRLIKVWGESRLWQDFNLVIIGGNRENPDEEQGRMMKSFDHYIQANPHLMARFAHVEALPNDIIRNVERKIMENTSGDYPNIYICSSLKEEFGISILEALSEKFLMFAPVKGGVKTYIENGKNGFLVDTSNWSELLRDVEKILYQSNRSKEDFEMIQERGQRTVLEKFSIEEIANKLMSLYLELKEEG
ncbi:MAG: glycosyltransferase family 4 protein [Eubacteriales bacterium]|nr:glycosyltransferase family 4 protein [Eubacteriales bacterium]